MAIPTLRTGVTLSMIAASSAWLAGCYVDDPPPPPYQPPCTEALFAGDPLGEKCGRLVDTEGRVVMLRGVNARVKGLFDVTWDPTQPPLMALTGFTAEDAMEMRAFGFDALRLPLNWSGIEPTADGGFDEAYLDQVAEVVGDCAAAGVRVLLDLHQDAYSKMMGGDGAALWAVQPPPATLGPPPGGETPALDPDVIAAFDTFFGDATAGAALRARFIAMATHVAARFEGDSNVIGLEIFNEPPVDMMALLPFYQPALAAFREVAPDKLFAFEPSALRNIADTAPLAPAPLGRGTAYAPHVYTFVFNTSTEADQEAMTKADLLRSEQSAAAEAASWDAPALVTEWGYGPTSPNAPEFFTWQSELQEQFQISSFLWVWKELPPADWGCFDYDTATGGFTERAWMKKSLARVRPAAVAGWPMTYGFDRATGEFVMTFQSDPAVDVPHLVAVAPLLGAPTAVTCDGATASVTTADAWGTLAITCGLADGQVHTLGVSVAPLP
jgi:endoglycosylceramidase